MRRILFLILITVAPIGLVRGEDLSQYKTADELWNHLQTLENTPPVNDRVQYIQQLRNLGGALLEFETRFGNDPRRWDAKLLRAQIESLSAQVAGHPRNNAVVLQTAGDVVSAADASASVKADAKFLVAKAHLEALARPGGTVSTETSREWRPTLPSWARIIQLTSAPRSCRWSWRRSSNRAIPTQPNRCCGPWKPARTSTLPPWRNSNWSLSSEPANSPRRLSI